MFGRLVSGRSNTQGVFHSVVGPCINHVPVRVNLERKPEPLEILSDLHHEDPGLPEITSNCTDWPVGAAYGSTVHYHNVKEETFFSSDTLDKSTLKAVQGSGEADAPGCVRVTAYPAGSECTLELSTPAEFSASEARAILDSLVDSISTFHGPS